MLNEDISDSRVVPKNIKFGEIHLPAPSESDKALLARDVLLLVALIRSGWCCEPVWKNEELAGGHPLRLS
jgi:hypothetical protein